MDQILNSKTATLQIYCNNCGKPLTRPRSAPHKRFCSPHCREQWHYQNKTLPKRRGSKPNA